MFLTLSSQRSTKSVDKLAQIRGVETVYLHCDVTNLAAVSMYEKGGYEILDSSNPVYLEFTVKLNLHDGATKGRNHYFLRKKITKQQTWLGGEPPNNVEENKRKSAEENKRGSLGFDITDLV